MKTICSLMLLLLLPFSLPAETVYSPTVVARHITNFTSLGVIDKVADPERVFSVMPFPLVVRYKVNEAEGVLKMVNARDRIFTSVGGTPAIKIVEASVSTPTMVVEIDSLYSLYYLLSSEDVVSVASNLPLKEQMLEAMPQAGMVEPSLSATGGGDGVAVAVIDTGIKVANVDLSPNAPQYAVTGRAKVSYNVIVKMDYSGMAQYRSTYDWANEHGTRVASIINTIAPKAKLIDLRVGIDNPDSQFSITLAKVANAVDWLLTNHKKYNVKIVNLSVGVPGSHKNTTCATPFAYMVEDLTKAGMLVVVAAGNDADKEHVTDPACSPHAFTVTSTADFNGRTSDYNINYGVPDYNHSTIGVPWWANYSYSVDIAAPGCTIQTVDSLKFKYPKSDSCGTSFSAPMVSGAAAVLLGAKGFVIPASRAKNLLMAGATTVATEESNGYEIPMLDLKTAMIVGGMWLPIQPTSPSTTVSTAPTVTAPVTGKSYAKCYTTICKYNTSTLTPLGTYSDPPPSGSNLPFAGYPPGCSPNYCYK